MLHPKHGAHVCKKKKKEAVIENEAPVIYKTLYIS